MSQQLRRLLSRQQDYRLLRELVDSTALRCLVSGGPEHRSPNTHQFRLRHGRTRQPHRGRQLLRRGSLYADDQLEEQEFKPQGVHIGRWMGRWHRGLCADGVLGSQPRHLHQLGEGLHDYIRIRRH